MSEECNSIGVKRQWCGQLGKVDNCQVGVFYTKHDLALQLVVEARKQGVQFGWIGADGFYGEDPAFLRQVVGIDHTAGTADKFKCAFQPKIS